MPEVFEGRLDVECAALRERAARLPREADWLRVTGPDRLRFTNGLVTSDLRRLEDGSGAYGFFTDSKGRVLADAAFLAVGDSLWIELPAGSGVAVAEHMTKYVVADRIDVARLDAWKTLLLAGPEHEPEVESHLGALRPSSDWGGVRLERPDGCLILRGERRLGVAGSVVAGPVEAVLAFEARLDGSGLVAVGGRAAAAVRIEEGVPWFGSEFGLDSGSQVFPQETGLEEWTVSYEKGCYLGQEVIARIHFRGKVNRSLRGLLFETGGRAPLGADLVLEGEVVGAAGEVVESPALGRPIGLAIVHHKAPPGAELEADGSRCRVTELPFGVAG